MIGEPALAPDPRFAELKNALADRLASAGASITPQNFASLLDPLMRSVLAQGFAEATAHEGTVWLLDEPGQHLIPAYNTGPNAAKFVATFKQPVNEGLIAMVTASEQPFVENEVYRNSRQSKRLDTALGVQTCSLIGVPFYLLKRCSGTISCVQLKTANQPDPPGFTPSHLAAVQRTASVLSRLLDFQFLGATVGWTPS
ncbi:MAG: GAF domain-containing protein [Verrucomicrobia subdivision 3 bacterium]|nr:GAF domain-containing protein [Limisphaerales bacterium]